MASIFQFRLWQLFTLAIAVGLFFTAFGVGNEPIGYVALIACGAAAGMTVAGGRSREVRAIAALAGAVAIGPLLIALLWLIFLCLPGLLLPD
jgi:hypothetical protein